MIIKDYNQKKMFKGVKDLFLAIYPENQSIAQRMCFDEKSIERYISAKVAIISNKIVGQANIFLKKGMSDMAELGYHVHPDFRGRGIGKSVADEAIKIAKKKGVRILLARTDESNLNSIALAKKLGFVKPPAEFLKKFKNLLIHERIKKMVCLYKLL